RNVWHPAYYRVGLDNGIGMVVQERGTIGGISVAENIFLGNLEQFKAGCFVSRRKLNKAAREVLKLVGMEHVNPAMPTQMLDLQDRKLIEIAKVISKKPDIFVVDETTTALSQTGRDKIYEIMEQWKQEGKSVLFISHDLDELMKVCSTLTVLRDGKLIRSLDREEFDEEVIKQLMVGRELKGDYYRSDYDSTHGEEVVLKMEDANLGEELKHLSLELHKGEILGVGGLSSCGMHTLGKALFGAVTLESGKVTTADGMEMKNEKIAMQHKIGYVSKDRDSEALNLDASILENIAVAGLDKIKKGIVVTAGNERRLVREQIDSLSIKCREPKQAVSELSGGNKQKVVFGKWIGCDSEILILD
ncbi:MAG: ATP-binding cassette domain-containing protein, partial [Lachnospiraceae bacterium]|nr:ATP-binding cassette domain-containing protein [Lachnospiraceae bacterium]